MDIRRLILWSALFVVGYSLYTQWHIEHPTLPPQAHRQDHANILLPADQTSVSTPTETFQNASLHVKPIVVQTDVLTVHIDPNQGNIVQASLNNYPSHQSEKAPFSLLYQHNKDDGYVATQQLFSTHDHEVNALHIQFKSDQTTYTLKPQEDTLVVRLKGEHHHLYVERILTFQRNRYLVDIKDVFNYEGPSNWHGYLSKQFIRNEPTAEKNSPFQIGSFTGSSYSNPEGRHYQKISFKDMNRHALDQVVQGGWIAMQQRYFLTAWIPDSHDSSRFYTSVLPHGKYAIGMVTPSIHLSHHETQTFHSKLYLGPEISDVLKNVAPHLNLTIDYGWLWFISTFLFSWMKWINQWIGNWGWSIILVTTLIKLAFYRLSATSYRSMAAMRQLQPKMQALRERYGDDKVKMSQATMELYRQEKVNPLSGCLPLIIQIPVMIGLYWVLAESVEFRMAPFMFWITDLSSSDPWHVLPILMGLTMLIQQKLNPAPPDPLQAKMMMFLPVLFTGLFWNFPSGLVLYWTVNNTLTILQQWYITRQYQGKKSSKSGLVVS